MVLYSICPFKSASALWSEDVRRIRQWTGEAGKTQMVAGGVANGSFFDRIWNLFGRKMAECVFVILCLCSRTIYGSNSTDTFSMSKKVGLKRREEG